MGSLVGSLVGSLSISHNVKPGLYELILSHAATLHHDCPMETSTRRGDMGQAGSV